MKPIRPLFTVSLCLIFLSNPVLAESLFNDIVEEPDLKMTCIVLGDQLTVEKRGDIIKIPLGMGFDSDYEYVDLSLIYPIVEADEKGKRYIYQDPKFKNIGMVDFIKKRHRFDYKSHDYDDCY